MSPSLQAPPFEGWLRQKQTWPSCRGREEANAIYLSSADRFRVSYYGMSFENISVLQRRVGSPARWWILFSSILILMSAKTSWAAHPWKGMSSRYLHELGFVLSADKGRVRVVRDTSITE